jgi:hypothetical protein
MWFPNWLQWIVLWLGLAASFIVWGSSDRDFVAFIAIGTIFIVWMIEGKRRKS